MCSYLTSLPTLPMIIEFAMKSINNKDGLLRTKVNTYKTSEAKFSFFLSYIFYKTTIPYKMSTEITLPMQTRAVKNQK